MGRMLVTGGAGFIGSHVAELLLSEGHSVLVVDNLRSGARSNLDKVACDRMSFSKTDVLDNAEFNRVVMDFYPEVCIHLAALVSVCQARSDPGLNFRLNLEATERVIETVWKNKTRRIVFASSAAVYGDSKELPLRETSFARPINLYGAAKLASEHLLFAAGRELGFEAIALRFFNVFGPRQRADSPYSGVISLFSSRLMKNEPLTIYGDGQQTRDFVSVADIAAAISRAATHVGPLNGAFNVCTGRETTLRDLTSILETVAERRATIAYQPPRPGDIVRSVGDPSAFAKATGFRTSASLADRLKELCTR